MSNLNAKNRQMKPFVPNSKIVFSLPLGGKVRRLIVALVGQITVTDPGAGAKGTVSGEGMANLIQRLYVIATPSARSRYAGGKIVDLGPRGILRSAVVNRSGKWIADLNGVTLSAGAAGVYSGIYFPFPIYFADPCQRNSLATALNLDVDASTGLPTYASVQVEIDTGSLASCFPGNTMTVDYSQLQVQIIDDRVAVPGDTATIFQESHSVLIGATNRRMLDEAMPQDGSFMSWLILGEQSAAYTLSDGLLNRAVISGPTLDYDKYAADIKEGDFADEWFDPSLTATGMYFIDFTDGSVQANTVPAGGLQTYFDVNSVSGANLDDLLIVTRRIFAPTPAASK